ncbi:hypothetical protein SAMN06269185_0517 [Natronoarchaeum philippinense]|uniref:Uncharacterized protein n=1 Tax=Natronoarchaeum philippinense TaxID=558529 RepID=A0A285N8L3_NATPI|nr:hypothetical protein [Natronoarchaeum philippinense]SNZ04306.1 hypothetical protein SAMN06269185_0517 [Natronoarchaeum philippinense]
MGTVNTQLVEEAREVFTRLGYTVSGDGTEFTAERGWKAVRVTTLTEPAEPPKSGGLHCFVTRQPDARELRRRLSRSDPDYDWAIISVENNDYEVIRAPPGPAATA